MSAKFIKRIVAHYVREHRVPYFGPVTAAEDVIRAFKFLETRDREEFVSLHLFFF